MNAVVKTTANALAVNAGHSVLGEREVRIPVSGKIRAGIKVLTRKAVEVKGAQEIYDAGVRAGRPFAMIEQELGTKLQLKNPLTPKNVPYFTVRPADFSVPESADRIMELYAEDRGEGMRLYRFPAIFATDAWLANMPHGLKCYTRSELVYWSDYSAEGSRVCKTRSQPVIDHKAQRARRTFGGRATVLRAERDGRCEPEQCQEYQDKKCTLSGGLLFYVAGVHGSGAVELSTNSFYAMQQFRQQMEMISFLRGGKLSGTIDGKPIFWITKRQDEVAMLDPATGAPKKVKQWIIHLDADIDMMRVFQASERAPLLMAGATAAAALEPAIAQPDEKIHTGVIEPKPVTPPLSDDREKIKTLRRAVADQLDFYKIVPSVFAKYACGKWGSDWSATTTALDLAQQELIAARADPETYLDSNNLSVPF